MFLVFPAAAAFNATTNNRQRLTYPLRRLSFSLLGFFIKQSRRHISILSQGRQCLIRMRKAFVDRQLAHGADHIRILQCQKPFKVSRCSSSFIKPAKNTLSSSSCLLRQSCKQRRRVENQRFRVGCIDCIHAKHVSPQIGVRQPKESNPGDCTHYKPQISMSLINAARVRSQ